MKTIHKYTLDRAWDQKVSMPRGAKILSVQPQNGLPQIWAEVDPNALTVERTFVVIGTGHKLPEGFTLEFLGTVQLQNGSLVLHVYEATQR